MDTNEHSSILKKAVEFWVGMKVAKGAAKFVAPVAIAGLGYFLYKKYKGNLPSLSS
jgi:hypothetical protein